jgi:arabinoxylan arabinofuranohydrolase
MEMKIDRNDLVRLLGISLGLCWTGVSFADNPIVQTKYTADPAPMVYKDTVYLYTSHDEETSTALGNFNMYNWMLYTSTDMANWTDHGIVAGTKAPNKTFSWAQDNGAWAPQVIERNGRFYLYAPIVSTNGTRTIAVAVADSPFGPFKDALNKGLVSTGTSDDIDPTVFIDNDGQAYLYWGNPNCYYVKLNADMISASGSPTKIAKLQTYQEGPWFYRRGDNYYLAFASTCCPEGIGYAMSTSPTGPWTYKNSIMDGNSQANGNHPGIIEFKGNSYVFGFNWRLQEKRTGARNKEMRSVSVEKFTYNADGTIPKLPFWSETGPEQVGTLDPYVQTEAETIAWGWDVRTETCSEGGIDVTSIENGDYIKIKGVDFGAGATSLELRVASTSSNSKIEVRLDTQTGKLVGTCAIASTGGTQTWATQTCAISGASAVHDLFFVFTGGSGSLLNFNWWKFIGSGTIDAGATGGSGGGGGGTGQGGADGGVGGSSGGSGGRGGTSSAGGGAGGSNQGGTRNTGGSVSSGGSINTGGSVSSGGSANTGGLASTGGKAAGGTNAQGSSGGQPSGGTSNSSTGGTRQASGGATSGAAGDSSSPSKGGCGCVLPGKAASRPSWASGLALLATLALLRRRGCRRPQSER